EYAGVTYAVTVVGEEAFVNDMTVVGLETSPVLREIGARAFMACVNLADVELAEGLEIIGDAAFAGCTKLPIIFIPSTVQYVGFKAFADCASLTYIYYDGTKAEWEALPNIKLAGIAKSVTIHFNDGETENGKGNIVGINNANADEAQKNGKFFENGELVIYKNGKAFTAAGAEKK
ncbi:MAG: leucine-rich repeat domain-containing protein, partial [Prevotella sp.]|nr:leucine-rich repeat domain-containing protein [Prevotella sp.]